MLRGSYFLAETVKYAYLLAMDSDPWPVDAYVLNTEVRALGMLQSEPHLCSQKPGSPVPYIYMARLGAGEVWNRERMGRSENTWSLVVTTRILLGLRRAPQYNNCLFNNDVTYTNLDS